ncbi:MAG: septum formation inhibitor [Halanaerobium sp.]
MYQNESCKSFEPKNEYLKKCSSEIFDLKKQAYTLLYIFLLLLISISSILYISQVLKLNNANYELHQLEENLENVREEREMLEVKLTTETSLAKVEKIAKTELNMVEAENKDVLAYNKNIETQEQFVADIPEEKFFLAQIYDKIIARIMTVQAESID